MRRRICFSFAHRSTGLFEKWAFEDLPATSTQSKVFGHKLRLRNTKLVIDGPGLCNCLYVESGFDRQCGGQYEEFYNVVLLFFAALDSRGVDSIVVLDGAHDRSDKKLDTFKKKISTEDPNW